MGVAAQESPGSVSHGIRPGREPLQQWVEVDETLLGGVMPGKSGRGADGKTVVVGAVEAKPGANPGSGIGSARSAGCGSPQWLARTA